MILVDNPAQHPNGDFALSPEGKAEADGENKLTYSGIGLYHPNLFNEYANGKQALAPILRKAMLTGKVTAEHYNGIWHDIGTPERLNELNQEL